MRVAALADVHGNAPALAAVLEEVERERPDLVVFCGDLTWGSLPQETLALVRAMEIPARFVRGNADRMVGVETRGTGAVDDAHAHARRPGVPRRIRADGATSTSTASVSTCFCHGSPRSDEECVTERTPESAVREFMAGVDETRRRHRARPREYDRVVDWNPDDRAREASGFRTRPGRARAGRCSAPTSSSGAPTTTSRRRSRSCARRTIRGSS